MNITCDRCHLSIPDCYDGERFTSGFYRTEPGSGWERYVSPGENKICDACMWTDPRYQKDYGDSSAKSLKDKK